MPTTKWTFRNREVKSSEKAKVTHSDYNTKIVIRMATRAESGTYTITAENINGTDTAKVEVTVIGKFLFINSSLCTKNSMKYF